MGKKLKCFFNKSIGFFVPRKQKSSIYSRAKEENFRNAIVKDVEDNDSMRNKTLEDLELLKVLGHGKLGKVFLARERGTSNCYAVKTLKLLEKEDARSLGEVRIMENTNHPFFVTLVKTFRTCSELHLVMEFAIGGDLEFHLTKFGAFDSMRTRFYAAEIVLGIDYLHQRNIVHRDLKLENIMLSRDGHVKIADFGLSQEVPMCGLSVCGTPLYMAPEIVLKLGYGTAVDWWSLGIVIYRMLYGKKPFKSTSRKILFTQIADSEIDYPRGIDRDARNLLQGLLRKNPHKRLGGGPRGAKEIKKHSFFASINWSMLLEKKLVPPFVPDLASNEDTSYFYDFYTDKNIESVKKFGLRPRVTYKSGHFC